MPLRKINKKKAYFLILCVSLFFESISVIQAQNPALENPENYQMGEFSIRKKNELPSVGYIVRTEFPQGLQHIFNGLDHIAFVIGLSLVVVNALNLFKVVTFFTMAHALTLTITSLNIIPISTIIEFIIEILITISIIWVGIENLYFHEQGVSMAYYNVVENKKLNKNRSIMAFCFGLVHGIAFSEHFRKSLINIDLSETSNLLKFLLKILFFNFGVDAGQLAIVFSAFFLLLLLKKMISSVNFAEKILSKIIIYGSMAISLTGVVFLVKRILKI